VPWQEWEWRAAGGRSREITGGGVMGVVASWVGAAGSESDPQAAKWASGSCRIAFRADRRRCGWGVGRPGSNLQCIERGAVAPCDSRLVQAPRWVELQASFGILPMLMACHLVGQVR
jgi:hypothetical protein